MHRLARALADVVGGFVLWVPGRVGSEFRVAYYCARGARIGKRTRLDPGVSIDGPRAVVVGADCWIDRFAILIAGQPRPGRETRLVGPQDGSRVGRIVIGDRCHIGAMTILSGIGGLSIGDDVTVSAGTKVYSLSHHYRSWARPSDPSVVFGSQAPAERQAMLQGTVVIGNNVGIGVDSLVLPGTVLGDRSFVRPFSQVSGTWPPNSLLGGRPATSDGGRFLVETDAAG